MDEMKHGNYGRLLLMAGLHFVAMFALMYAMVDRFAYALPNLNQVYMAALMTSPMLIIELLLMGSMYPDKRRNLALLATAAIVLATSFLSIRQQAGIGDREFLRSMIPHHAGAILMCQQATLHDPQILKLCNNIVASQQTEIEQMKALLQSPEVYR